MIDYATVLEAVKSGIVQIKEGEFAGEDLHEDTVLYDFDEHVTRSLGLDSLDALELISHLERTLDIRLPDDVNIEDIHTIGDIARALRSRET